MKRFRKKESLRDDPPPLLTDESDYMSAIPGYEETQRVSNPESISQVLSLFESENLGGRAKRRKVDELMVTVRDIGLQQPILPPSILDDAPKKNVGFKLLQRFGYSEAATSSLNSTSCSLKQQETDKAQLNISSSMLYQHNEGLGLRQKQQRIHDSWLERMKKKTEQFTTFQQLLSNYRRKYAEYWKVVKVIYELDLRSFENNSDKSGDGHTFSIPETQEFHVSNQSLLYTVQTSTNEPTIRGGGNLECRETMKNETAHEPPEDSVLYSFPSPSSLQASPSLSVEDLRLKNQELSNRVYTLLLHLREHHFYCYYCSMRYSSVEDLLNTCHEVTESDHEDETYLSGEEDADHDFDEN